MVVTKTMPCATFWQRGLLALPSLVMTILFPFGWGWSSGAVVYGLISAYAALAILCDWPGRFVGLAWSFMLWIALGLFIGAQVSPVFGVTLFGAVGVALPLLAFRVGMPWGMSRAERLRQSGRGIRESQWVYVGPETALGHPIAARLAEIWVVIGFLLLQLLGVWSYAILSVSFGPMLYAGCATGCVAFLIFLLVRRHPAAWPLTWVPFALAFPISFPLMMYWADGIRPNLIYRHRFERLLDPEPA